jgi:hypothetical protein
LPPGISIALTIEALASREGKTERSIRMILSLAFLAADIIKAAIEGRLPRGFGLKRLIDLPMAWPPEARWPARLRSGNVDLFWGPGILAGTRGLPGGAEGIRTDGHRGRSEISSYSSFRRFNARSLLAARAPSIAVDAHALDHSPPAPLARPPVGVRQFPRSSECRRHGKFIALQDSQCVAAVAAPLTADSDALTSPAARVASARRWR